MKLPRCTNCKGNLDISEVATSALIVCSVCGHEFTQEWYHRQKMTLNPDAMKTFVLDGSKVDSLSDFYDEVQRVLCPSFRGFGRNWHALRDVLRGGFGTFEEGEPVTVLLNGVSALERNLASNEVRRIQKIFNQAENIDFQMK